MIIASLLLFLTANAQQCSQSYVRRDFRELIDQSNPNQLLPEGQAFIDGVHCLMSRQGTSGGSLWDDLTRTHMSAVRTAHGVAAFFPWHRLFLLSVEQAMRQCTGNQNVYIPYWNFGAESQAPEQSAIWRFMGNVGQCVQTGIFSGGFGQVTVPQPHCIARSFDDGALSPLEAEELTMSITDYDQFRQRIEGTIHAVVHSWVGGDMVAMYSPNDPVFYLHHSNIDRLWDEWQQRNPSLANTYSGNGADGPASSSDTLDMNIASKYIGNRPVSAMFSTSSWCYSYSTGGTSVRPGNPTGGSGVGLWSFCSANSQCATSCCSNRWSNDGREKCHPESACGNTSSGSSGLLGEWTFCSSSSQCQSNCCSQLWSNDGQMKCHPNSACPGRSPNNQPSNNQGNQDQAGTCGNGNRGNGKCSNGACCSPWGWCGTGSQFCVGSSSNIHRRSMDYAYYSPPSEIYFTPRYATTPANNGQPREPNRSQNYGSPMNPSTPPTNDRNDIYNIRMYKPIPSHYIQANNLNETMIRIYEDQLTQIIDQINAQNGYVSECALVNSPQNAIFRPVSPNEKTGYVSRAKDACEKAKLELGIPVGSDGVDMWLSNNNVVAQSGSSVVTPTSMSTPSYQPGSMPNNGHFNQQNGPVPTPNFQAGPMPNNGQFNLPMPPAMPNNGHFNQQNGPMPTPNFQAGPMPNNGQFNLPMPPIMPNNGQFNQQNGPMPTPSIQSNQPTGASTTQSNQPTSSQASPTPTAVESREGAPCGNGISCAPGMNCIMSSNGMQVCQRN